jgi:hypothetical protein
MGSAERERRKGKVSFNHVNYLNKQILNNSDTRELFGGRDGPDRQTDRGKNSDEERATWSVVPLLFPWREWYHVRTVTSSTIYLMLNR